MTILVLLEPAWWIPPVLALIAMFIWFAAWAVFSLHYGTPKAAAILPRDRGQYVGRHRAVEDTPDPEPRRPPAVNELEQFHEGHVGRPTAGCPGCEAVETAGATA